MPTIPVMGRRVAPAGTPAVEARPQDFAVPTAPDLSEPQGLVQKEIQDANQVAVADADAQIVRAKTARLWDPQSGAMNARGKDAIPASDAATSAFQEDAAKIEATLTNDVQKQAFRRRVDQHYADLGGQLGQHVATQIKKYDADVAQGHVDALADAALKSYSDAPTVDKAVDDTKAALTDFWRRNGHGEGNGVDEFAQQHIADRISAIRASVFKQYSDTGQDLAASAYLDAHRGEFTAKDLLPAEKIAEAGSTRAASLQNASAIVNTAPTLSAAMSEVEKIQDPRIQDATAERVRRHFADQAADITHQRQQAFQQASAIVERSKGDYDQVPLSLRELLSPEENTALKHRADDMRNPKRVTNMNVLLDFKNRIALGHGADVLKSLPDHRDDLSDSDFRAVIAAATGKIGATITKQDNREYAADRHDQYRAEADSTRKAHIAETDAKKAAAKASHDQMIRDLMSGKKPSVPGAPLAKPVIPNTGPPGDVNLNKPKRTGMVVPSAWVDHANTQDAEYAAYLTDMGVDLG